MHIELNDKDRNALVELIGKIEEGMGVVEAIRRDLALRDDDMYDDDMWQGTVDQVTLQEAMGYLIDAGASLEQAARFIDDAFSII